MTSPTAMAQPLTYTNIRRSRVSLADLYLLTLRQHRVGIAATVAGYLVFALLVRFTNNVSVTSTFHFDPKNVLPALAGAVAVFWGAPLLANEYERHTNLLVWSQDVSPRRWLLAKVTLLGALIVALTAVLAIAEQAGFGNIEQDTSFVYWQPVFEAAIPLAIGYAVFGFAIGLAASAVWRRVIPAMATALAGFAGIRLLISTLVRPYLFLHLITPVQWITPVTDNGSPDGLWLDFHYLNTAGQAVPEDAAFAGIQLTPDTNVNQVLLKHGVVKDVIVYQPASRVGTFQLAELAIYLVLIAIAVFIAFRAVRRA